MVLCKIDPRAVAAAGRACDGILLCQGAWQEPQLDGGADNAYGRSDLVL